MERREGILRLCRYDSESDVKVIALCLLFWRKDVQIWKKFQIFKHEFLILKMLAKTYTTRTHRIHYPAILGQGCLAELRYLNVTPIPSITLEALEALYHSSLCAHFAGQWIQRQTSWHRRNPEDPSPLFHHRITRALCGNPSEIEQNHISPREYVSLYNHWMY